MGTLWIELGPVADAVSDRPRVYADANVPAGIVAFMREKLRRDVLSVMEQPDLRRARDTEHYRLARQLRRTLVTWTAITWMIAVLPALGSGCWSLRPRRTRPRRAAGAARRPLIYRRHFALDGRKLHAHSDWSQSADGKDSANEPR
jgi:hypothetical protein